jgi:hypothetical protein
MLKSFSLSITMNQNKKLLIFCIETLKTFHSQKVNSTHPLVNSSAVGALLMCIFILIGIYTNTYLSPISENQELNNNFHSRFSPDFFMYIGIAFIFFIISFKALTQGRKYGILEALFNSFFRKKTPIVIHQSVSWKSFWMNPEKSICNDFVNYLQTIKFTEYDCTDEDTKKIFHNLFNNIETVTYSQFEAFANSLYTEVCKYNRDSVPTLKSALFLDINTTFLEEQYTQEVNIFKKVIMQAHKLYIQSKTTIFIKSSKTILEIVNTIPYVILLVYFYLFLKTFISYDTSDFFMSEQKFIFFLQITLTCAFIYSIISFLFMRKTEDWREFWNNNGVDFLLSFHQLGNNKIPPYVLPDTEFYDPNSYYKVFDASTSLKLSSLYNDQRFMFFDSSQYYFMIIYQHLLRSYNINIDLQTMQIQKKQKVLIKQFDSY